VNPSLQPRRIASAARSWLRFHRTGRLAFDAAKLNAAAFELARRAFSNPAIAEAWAEDRAALGEAYASGGLAGGVNPGDRRALHALIMQLEPERVLEIGTHVGASTLAMAQALRAVSAAARLTTVDIRDVNDPCQWQRNGLAMSLREHAARIGCLDRITFEVGSSVEFMRRAEPGFDFIFLDGDHDATTVYREIAAALPLLSLEGVILLHDYYPGGRPLFADGVRIAGPYRAVRRILDECPGIAIHPLGMLPWPTKQGSNITSLALLARARHDGDAR
jgi:predicted O-methyltransferase YrrM